MTSYDDGETLPGNVAPLLRVSIQVTDDLPHGPYIQGLELQVGTGSCSFFVPTGTTYEEFRAAFEQKWLETRMKACPTHPPSIPPERHPQHPHSVGSYICHITRAPELGSASHRVLPFQGRGG